MPAEDPVQQHTGQNKSWVDRNGLSHGGIAIIWVIAAFIMFQVFGGVISAIMVIIQTPASSGGLNAQQLAQLSEHHAQFIFWATAVGQILFLALATWLFCRIHTGRWGRSSFLRFQSYDNTLKMIGIAFVLMLVVQPIVWLLGWLNSLIPMPHLLHSLQSKQMDTIIGYLSSQGHLWIDLLTVAVVPAFCEETLFRGYALRSFQKSWGPVAAMIITGIIFGLFHLEPANFIPLAGIGILLAYLTWATQSIFPAMVAHFVNNGTGILLLKFYPNSMAASTSASKFPPIGLLILSIVLSAFLLYFIAHNKMNPKLTSSS